MTALMRSLNTVPATLTALGRGGVHVRLWTMFALLCAASALYGAVMGSWEVSLGNRWFLMLFGAVKMPLLVISTTLICLPGFFVLNTIAGLREDFSLAMRAIFGAQAAFAAALLSLAPLTLFIYTCGVDRSDAVLANAAMFTLATVLAQGLLFRSYPPLREKSPAHHRLLWAWLILSAFVGIHMGWMMRPFIGSLESQPIFLRDETLTNAYVVVFRLIAAKLGIL